MTISSSNPTRASTPLPYRTLLLVGTLLAFAIRTIALDRLGIAYDESASAMMARATPAEIIEFHWHAAFEHPPLWVLLLHYWSRIAGQSEIALRWLPALAGVLIVPLTWRLALTIWPGAHRLALMSAAAVAFSPVLVYYSQETRMYTLVVALMLVAILLVLRLRLAPTWGKIIAFWVVGWAMLGLHYYAALGLAIQAAILGIEGLLMFTRSSTRRRRGPRFPWAKLVVAYLGALAPVILWMLFAPGFHTTLTVVLDKAGENPVSWQYFLGDLWRELSFGSIRFQPDYAPWGYSLAALLILGGILAFTIPQQNHVARIGVWLLLAIIVLPILSGAIALRTLVPRYILWIVPLIYLIATIPAARLWRIHWLLGAILFTAVVSVEIIALQYYFGPYRKSDYREMTAYLQAHGDPQRELLLLEAPRQHLLTKYYLPSTWEVHPMPTLPLPDYWPVTAPLLVPEDEDDRLQQWLVERDALWVSFSSEAEVDRGEFLAKYLTAVAFRERCIQWLDARLCHYVSPHHLSPTALAIPYLLFGDTLALEAAQAAIYVPPNASPSILVQLDWLAESQPAVDYKVALRFVASDGTVLDEWNDFPIGPLLPPTTWNGGDRKPGYAALRLPADLAPGRYSLQIQLYDPSTFTPTPYTFVGSQTTTSTNDTSHTLAIVVVAALGDDTMHPVVSFEPPPSP